MMSATVRNVAGLASVVVAVFVLSALPGHAADPSWMPKPARGQGDKCVAETDWMRRNHMTVLMHQRDDTVHAGIRTSRFSLKGCVDCHAVKGADGKPVTIASRDHFCRTCHDYTAVRIDCFECHASRPESAETPAGSGNVSGRGHDGAALAQYLRSVGR